ncbi:unnamed protein product [Zymoseptoria tritici ST99CH_1E4]|uniref:F-box domain-containing protein n=1 Tax=Zymoseptoria tritici ST99CH_1E4 TaxID=1276532 RepID=A0A2H1GT48_ZYMTR|nr:unnamed protein product [Zymoseptoria tritici ST99CH_1E4]
MDHQSTPTGTAAQTQPFSTRPSDFNAVYEVFHTIELLEQILLELPQDRHLLLSQRTCKAFRDTMKDSSKLQRRVFLLPSDSASYTPWNPMLATVADDFNRCPIILTARTSMFDVNNLKAVFKHSGQLWALAETGVTWIQVAEPLPVRRSRLPRPRPRRRPKDHNLVSAWCLRRVANNEVLSCPIFDLASTSLRNMYITQPSAKMTVVLYSGHPNATTIQHGFEGRCNLSDSCVPKWRVFGHAFAKFEGQGKTVGKIFEEIDAIDGEYRTPVDWRYPAEIWHTSCRCESCQLERIPKEEEAEARARAMKKGLEENDDEDEKEEARVSATKMEVEEKNK